MIYWKYMCLIIAKTKGYWYLKIAYIIFLNQDAHEREFVNCDPFLRQIFQTDRMKFAEIPQRLNPLLHPPDPIVSTNYYSTFIVALSALIKCSFKFACQNMISFCYRWSIIWSQLRNWGTQSKKRLRATILM